MQIKMRAALLYFSSENLSRDITKVKNGSEMKKREEHKEQLSWKIDRILFKCIIST